MERSAVLGLGSDLGPGAGLVLVQVGPFLALLLSTRAAILGLLIVEAGGCFWRRVYRPRGVYQQVYDGLLSIYCIMQWTTGSFVSQKSLKRLIPHPDNVIGESLDFSDELLKD